MTDAARDERATEVFPTQGLPPASRDDVGRRRGGAGRAWVVALVILAVLAGLLVIADLVTRNIAEAQVAEQLEANLPQGVDGDIDVTIGGFSVIGQYLMGSMDEVRLSAPELTVAGSPIDVAVELRDVPPSLDGPVGRIDATVEAEAATIDEFVTLAGVEGGVTLGEGAVSYERSFDLLGFSLLAVVTATPVAAGDTVVLESVSAELAAGETTVDVSGLADRVLGDGPITICVAEYLPEGAQVTGITITEDSARVELDAEGLSLDEESLATTGSCS